MLLSLLKWSAEGRDQLHASALIMRIVLGMLLDSHLILPSEFAAHQLAGSRASKAMLELKQPKTQAPACVEKNPPRRHFCGQAPVQLTHCTSRDSSWRKFRHEKQASKASGLGSGVSESASRSPIR